MTDTTPATLTATPASLRSLSGLEELCAELLIHILSFLEPREIASCQRVSRRLCLVIQASAQLQWTIESYLADVERCSTTTLELHERVEKLRLWRATRRNSALQRMNELKAEFTTHSYSSLKIFGTMYGLLHDDVISVIQPASTLRDLPNRVWSVELGISGLAVEAFAYEDQYQLLVVVEHQDQDRMYNIRFYSTSTGGNHPLAYKPIISIPAPEFFSAEFAGFTDTYVSVCGSVLAFKVSGIEDYLLAEAWVWDWKTGDILLNIYSESEHDEIKDVRLLDPSHCVVCIEDEVYEDFDIAIFDLRPGNPSRQKSWAARESTALLRLQLPEIQIHDEGFVTISLDMDPFPSPTQSREGAFRCKADSRLLRIEHYVEFENVGPTIHQCDFVTPVSTLYTLLAGRTPGASTPVAVPWSVWSLNSRVFAYDKYFCPNSFVSGAQYITKYRPTEATPYWTYIIHDFTRAATLSTTGDTEGDQSLVCQQIELTEPILWKHPVKDSPCLPYRMYIRTVKGSPEELTYLGEDYVVVIGEDRHHVYSI